MAKKKKRAHIPKAVEESVLKEFNHQCAICGAPRPQLHHIDEDPSKCEPEDLLPLCPNCHLVDQHNPTAPVDTGKLALFRRYKDPTILHPKFQPLWKRCRFLLSREKLTFDQMRAHVGELLAFIAALEMGGFYADQINDLFPAVGSMRVIDATEAEVDAEEKRRAAEYREIILRIREQVLDLIVELLRYQDWLPPDQYRIGGG